MTLMTITSKGCSPEAIRAQVEKLAESPLFASSGRLIAFLWFIVNETISGNAALLKESTVGNAIYSRSRPYDPRIDSAVRVEARRLRHKLTTYYEGSGETKEIKITLPVGTYVPEFAPLQMGEVSWSPTEARSQDIFEPGGGVTIAVMPFRSLSSEPADESFADGLTDELIFALSRAPGMRVASRNTVFQYKNCAYSLPQFAAQLGLTAVLHGTVRRDSDLMRITIESANPRGFIVWSDRFDIPNSNAFEMQQRVSATLLSRVRFDSSPLRRSQVGPGPIAVDAHGKIYRARRLLDQQTASSIREASCLFAEVANSVPGYARGHAGVADCHCDLYRLGLLDHNTASYVAKAAASRALTIDPDSVEAHSSRATILAWLDRDAVEAEAAFLRAFELGENARASRQYGVFLTILGRYADAERAFAKAREIEPYSAQQDIVEAVEHFQSRHYALSIEANATTRIGSIPDEALVHHALAHVFANDLDGARICANLIEPHRNASPELNFSYAEVQAWHGAPAHARQLLKSPEPAPSNFARATLAAALGEDNVCLDALDATIEGLELATVWIDTDPRFDRLRGIPRFAQILARAQDAKIT